MRNPAAVALFALLAACSGGSGTSGRAVADLEKAKESIHPMQPIAEAQPAIVEALGEPDKSDDAGLHWYAKDGDTCKELFVGKMGDMVGGVEVKASKDCP